VNSFDFQRFLNAQENIISDVYAELAQGKKRSHWMWFVFPQLTALGRSVTAVKYGIESSEQAQAYLAHPELRSRLLRCIELALTHPTRSAHEIFGSPDDLKFQSSMTLFREAEPDLPQFQQALDTFYDGKPDERTIELLKC
jgi:uncharacterized protein (DUF1810 family)